MDLSLFGLFVSLNPKDPQPVARYGTGVPGRTAAVLIGAERDVADPTVVHYRPEQIVAIPRQELDRFRREYRRAIRDGHLLERSAEEYAAQEKARLEAEEQRKKERQKEREEAERRAKEANAANAGEPAPELTPNAEPGKRKKKAQE